MALSISAYSVLNNNLFTQLQNRVRNIAALGARTVDSTALSALLVKVGSDLDSASVRAVEATPQYATVSDELNAIRNVEPRLIRYVYLFAPTGNPDEATYVVDADVLQLEKEQGNGQNVSEDDISHFNSPFDISTYPVAREALSKHQNLVERAYSYDEVFHVRSVSGYAPVFAKDGVTLLAVLGIDMVDVDVRQVLQQTLSVSAISAAVAILLSLFTSILLGSFFTRGIIRLDEVVRQFAAHDLAARADVHSRDEVGSLGLSFNYMADTIERYSDEQEKLLKAYGRFVPTDFLTFLRKRSITEVQLGDQTQREMTILFSDIRSFTSLSESMSPEENFNFINSYLSRVGPEIRAHRGFIDKYIGDAIMALFPETPEDAVLASIAMRKRLVEYNGHRASVGYSAVDTGIGIHTGSLMLGTVGEAERMDGSVIADAVNLCSRLEALTRYYGVSTLISAAALDEIPGRDRFNIRFVDRVRVRGRNQPVIIYELFDGDPEPSLEAKRKMRGNWIRALNLYYKKQFEDAAKLINAIRKVMPEDRLFEIFEHRCARLIREGVPEGWNGVEIIELK